MGDVGLALADCLLCHQYGAGLFGRYFYCLDGTVVLAGSVKTAVEYAADLCRLGPPFVVYFYIPIPSPVMSCRGDSGAGAIPVMILVLGMQMADMRGQGDWRLMIPAVGLRLLVAPFVAFTGGAGRVAGVEPVGGYY
ncbi:MAG: hypothetical protein M5U34_35740 [Chloroflexi bacterium]|nr:hypothetical protein [Chloroflexota bacterium]